MLLYLQPVTTFEAPEQYMTLNTGYAFKFINLFVNKLFQLLKILNENVHM